jgi:hypothetical protein
MPAAAKQLSGSKCRFNDGFDGPRFDKILAIDCVPSLGWLLSTFRSRQDLILENLALRQQLLALHAKRPRRQLTAGHTLFWVSLRKVWARWKESLIVVTPRTVVNWDSAGFRLYWKWILRAKPKGGRKPTGKIRALILQMVAENPTWGAPRIHGEPLTLGLRCIGNRQWHAGCDERRDRTTPPSAGRPSCGIIARRLRG